MNPLVTYSFQRTVGTWGWRHELAWKQLSFFWRLQVKQDDPSLLQNLPIPASAYSLAITAEETSGEINLEKYFSSAPVVVFLDHVNLHINKNVTAQITQDQPPSGKFQHIFEVNVEHQLTHGLPKRVATFGPLADITPLVIEEDLQILVWLDGNPIIGYHPPHLIIGADAWQLGNPSVPLVYPIILNWLRTIVGYELHIDQPRAMIRLDDLPTTAEALLHQQPTNTLDRKRAAMLRRLRRFAKQLGIKINLMYSSHYYGIDGSLKPIGDSMVRSVREIQLGLEQNVFEIGAHGMVHLRFPWDTAIQDADPREFLDLDENETQMHIKVCKEEIWRLFKVQPKSFVAPAWGYKSTVTKNLAGQQFDVILDSSQHVENGSCNVFAEEGDESPAFNCTETFRSGSRMLSYTSTNFWKCYALAGIPVHYLQHTDMNWYLLRNLLGTTAIQFTGSNPSRLTDQLVTYMQNSKKPILLRSIATGWFMVNYLLFSSLSRQYLLKILNSSSIYSIIEALCQAGYQSVTLTQFTDCSSNLMGNQYDKQIGPI